MFTFYFINVFNNWRPAYLLQIGITYYIIFLTIPVIRNLCIPETVVIQWFAEYSVKIDCIIRFPSPFPQPPPSGVHFIQPRMACLSLT